MKNKLNKETVIYMTIGIALGIIIANIITWVIKHLLNTLI